MNKEEKEGLKEKGSKSGSLSWHQTSLNTMCYFSKFESQVQNLTSEANLKYEMICYDATDLGL